MINNNNNNNNKRTHKGIIITTRQNINTERQKERHLTSKPTSKYVGKKGEKAHSLSLPTTHRAPTSRVREATGYDASKQVRGQAV